MDKTMSRAQREPVRHIHDSIVDEVNEMSIRVKLHWVYHGDLSAEATANLLKSQKAHPYPSPTEVSELLDRVVSEMNRCTEPYIKR